MQIKVGLYVKQLTHECFSSLRLPLARKQWKFIQKCRPANTNLERGTWYSSLSNLWLNNWWTSVTSDGHISYRDVCRYLHQLYVLCTTVIICYWESSTVFNMLFLDVKIRMPIRLLLPLNKDPTAHCHHEAIKIDNFDVTLNLVVPATFGCKIPIVLPIPKRENTALMLTKLLYYGWAYSLWIKTHIQQPKCERFISLMRSLSHENSSKMLYTENTRSRKLSSGNFAISYFSVCAFF